MSAYQLIEAADLSRMMAEQKITLVDVRNAHEVAAGVIPGAIHVPLAMIPVTFDTFSKAQPLVLYCHTGIRSSQAAAYISSKEYKNVMNLYGGVVAWGKAGLTLEKLA